METMDGPINFGERDQWWGLLVEGFYEPLYNMNYNFPYYVDLFENYGFKTYFNQECFALPITQKLQKKLYDATKPSLRTKIITLNTLIQRIWTNTWAIL